MEGLSACGFVARLPPCVQNGFNRSLPFSCRRPRPFLVVAASRDPELNKWDQMELEFGRFVGEDPKLTLAKIMTRKDNPDVSYLDVEKSFKKNKGNIDGIMVNLPSTVHPGEDRTLQSQKPKNLHKQRELNLSRPIMRKALKSKKDGEKRISGGAQENHSLENIQRNIATSRLSLRKPTVFHDDIILETKNTRLKIKPNLYLKTAKDSAQSYGEITLLKKPEMGNSKGSAKPIEGSVSCDKPYDASSNGLKWVDDVDTSNVVGTAVDIEQNSFECSAQYDTINWDKVIEGSLDGNTDSSHMPSELGLQPSPTHKNVLPIDTNMSSTSLLENPISLKADLS